MRFILLPMFLVLGCTTYAAAHCNVTEYTEHYEVVCVGDTKEGLQVTQVEDARMLQDQTVYAQASSIAEVQDAPPELSVRNDLAREHMAAWLKSRP